MRNFQEPQPLGHEVLTRDEIQLVHDELVTACARAGYGGERLRDAFLLGFARAIEAAVLLRIGPQLGREVN